LTDRCIVESREVQEPATRKDIQKYFEEGYDFVLFIGQADNGLSLEWRLYDPTDVVMVKGKKIKKNKSVPLHSWLYGCIDELWFTLTGQKSSFCSYIAYVKRNKNSRGRMGKTSVVQIMDSNGTHARTLWGHPGIYVGLAWHDVVSQGTISPRLYCSEFSPYNVRFIGLNLAGKRTPILDLEGTCVGISVSKTGAETVYC